MMTPMNKIFIEVIYLAFIDLGWKTYYHSYKCHTVNVEMKQSLLS